MSYLVLTLVVVVGAANGIDGHLREIFRPHDEWGRVQLRADRVVQALRPAVMVVVLALVATAVCLSRQSWRLAVKVLAVSAVTAAITQATKVLVARPDPHHGAPQGTSFPSGHTVSILVCLGLSLLLVRPGTTRRWQWALVAFAVSAMGVALLLEAAHWATDIAGGALLGTAVLSAAYGWLPELSTRSDDDPGGTDRAVDDREVVDSRIDASDGAEQQAGEPRS